MASTTSAEEAPAPLPLQLPPDVAEALRRAFPSLHLRCTSTLSGFDQRVHCLAVTEQLPPVPSPSPPLPPLCVLRLSKGSLAFHSPPLLSSPLQWRLLRCLHRRLPPSTGALLPRPLFCSARPPFLVESFVPGADLSSLLPLPPSVLRPLWSDVGRHLHHLHSLPCRLFGGIRCVGREGGAEKAEVDGDSDDDGLEGSSSRWLDVDLLSSFVSRVRVGGLTPSLTAALLSLFHRHLPFLSSFSSPVLCHGDLCSNNLRVDAGGSLVGLLDFVDAVAGDGLFDVGRALSHWKGDWAVVEWVEAGYWAGKAGGRWSRDERSRIALYAAAFALWMLERSAASAVTEDKDELRRKYVDTLTHLAASQLSGGADSGCR